MKYKRGLLLIALLCFSLALCSCSVADKAIDKAADKVVDSFFHPEKKDDDGKKHNIAAAPGYDERLAEFWENADEDDFIWTITINDVDEIDVFGLCTASYQVNMSASHIGPDMYGAYFGEFGFDYSADISGLKSLLTAMGGSMDSKTSGWFKNDKYTFSIGEYDKDEEDTLIQVVNSNTEFATMSPEEQAIISGLTGAVYGEKKMEDYEKSNTPSGFWWDFEMPMTDGDMSGYIQMNGILAGMVNGYSAVDSTGSNVDADITVVVPPIFADRYKEKTHFENPMPHTLKIYPNNRVVMEFFNQQGGPVTTKLYGTIDKIPVSDTIKVD